MNIPMIKVPTFTTTLPVANIEVEYRPYVVKEEKLLILANESNDVETILNAVGDIVKGCTNGVVNIKQHSMVDVQHTFLKIRSKSLGDLFDFYGICQSCKEKRPLQLSVDEFKVNTFLGHSNTIELDKNIHVVMRYPTFYDFMRLYMSDDEDVIYEVIADCIEKYHTEEETYINTVETRKDFLELIQNITVPQFEKLENFFVTMPRLQAMKEFNCQKCSEKNSLIIEGISNFFA